MYLKTSNYVNFVKQQLSVKEFYLKIIPWRLFTFRVCPGTKVCNNNFGESAIYYLGFQLIITYFYSLPTMVQTQFIGI